MTRKVVAALIAGLLGLMAGAAILYVVGETVDTMSETHCAPYRQCKDSTKTNHPNCDCWWKGEK